MSMTVHSKEDLRLAYWLLLEYKKAGKGDSPKAGELKKTIRSYQHLPHSTEIIRDDGMDGYISLMQLPETLDDASKEDAVEWFENMCYIEPTYSAYDCTGRPFTSWYKVFRRRGHWFAYHSVAFDV